MKTLSLCCYLFVSLIGYSALGQNLALDKPATASSVQAAHEPTAAVDGRPDTRWASDYASPSWIKVDLEATTTIKSVVLNWERASAESYFVMVSDVNSTPDPDSDDWTILSTQSGQPDEARVDELTDLSGSGHYIAVYATNKLHPWGYSLWELEVYGTPGSDPDPDPEPDGAVANPSNVSASAAVFAVTLRWTPAADTEVESYRIYEGSVPKDLVDGNNTSATISGLQPATRYTYVVKTVNTVGDESSGVLVSFTTQDNNPNPDGGDIAVGNIALAVPVAASSVADGSDNVAANAVDGNRSSRWESKPTDDESFTVDLGSKYQIGRVILRWERASGQRYLLEVSDDSTTWTPLYEFNETDLPDEARVDDLPVAGSGRYVRMVGLKRNTPYGYSLFGLEVYSPGSGPDDIPNPNPNPNPDPVPPGPAAFSVTAPTGGAMITNTRRPTLSWEADPGATRYEVWVNITRTDYDWYALGNLLDRFTKLADVTEPRYPLEEPLSDRWTYKWYVVAVSGSEKRFSDLGQFSVYLPEVEQQADQVELINGARDLNKNGSIEPYENWRQSIPVRVRDLMERMTMEEKAYQMFYNAQSFPLSGWAFGPGTVSDMFSKQLASANTRLGIPFVSAGDCIHGYSTTYPTQSALAASRNLELARQCGNLQRVEQHAVGFRGTLAPLAEVGTKVLYPRIQEGCGEDADFAAAMVRAMVCGLQGGPELNPGSVMVTTKHWPGEGAGGEALIVYDGVTIKYHMKPWFANVEAGAGSVMPGYAGSSFLDPGGPGAGDSKPILNYLRKVVGFDGIICTDWLPSGAWVDAARAGSDVMGGADPGAVGFSMTSFIAEVGEERINEAVERILVTKFKLGVFEDPYGDPVNGPDTWFTPEHVELATQAARESMTLLKNDGLLPLSVPAGANLLVTGSRANNGESYSIWTSYFHDEYGAKTMYEAIQEKAQAQGINVYLDNGPAPDAAVVILGEPSYTHGTAWDKEKPYVHDAYYAVSGKYEYDSTTLSNVRKLGIPYVVVMIMPRPYVLTELVDDANAVLLAYRPGDGGGPALADILFGEFAPQGKLPWQLPRSLDQVGKDNLREAKERWDIPFDLGATSAEIQQIRSKIAAGEPLEPIYGNPLFQYGFGLMNYGRGSATTTPARSLVLPEEESPLLVFPNPATDRLRVRTRQGEATGSYEVLSPSGEQLLTGRSDTSSFSINIGHLPPGVYLLRVERVGQGPVGQLFIKE